MVYKLSYHNLTKLIMMNKPLIRIISLISLYVIFKIFIIQLIILNNVTHPEVLSDGCFMIKFNHNFKSYNVSHTIDNGYIYINKCDNQELYKVYINEISSIDKNYLNLFVNNVQTPNNNVYINSYIHNPKPHIYTGYIDIDININYYIINKKIDVMYDNIYGLFLRDEKLNTIIYDFNNLIFNINNEKLIINLPYQENDQLFYDNITCQEITYSYLLKKYNNTHNICSYNVTNYNCNHKLLNYIDNYIFATI